MITSEILSRLAPSTPKGKRDRFLPFLNEFLPIYGINTSLRVAAFLATATMESDYWKATHEYASGNDYDIEVNPRKARALGNTEPGDGRKYKGAGIFQTTGKKNFAAATQKIGTKYGVDFVRNPELLQQPKYAVESACVFWNDNKLNKFADQGLSGFFGLQGTVNRGNASKTALDYYEKRLPLYEKARQAVGSNFKFKEDSATVSATNPAEDRPSDTSDTPAAFESPKSDNPSNEQSPNLNENAPKTEVVKTETEKTDEQGNKTKESSYTEAVTNFDPKSIPAFIPRFGKQWFLSLIPGGGLLATIAAKVAAMPDWLVFMLGFFTGITTVLFVQMLIKHREMVISFITKCYEITANPEMHNLIPTNADAFVGNRQNELINILQPPPATQTKT